MAAIPLSVPATRTEPSQHGRTTYRIGEDSRSMVSTPPSSWYTAQVADGVASAPTESILLPAMSDPAIVVEQLSKPCIVPVRGSGLAAAFKSLVRRQTRAVEAVRQVSFRVEPGEIVGFLGPNGAGKTTTLKMLSG